MSGSGDKGDEAKLYPLESLIHMYYKSVGHNSTLIVGLTPDNRGVIPEPDAQRCKEWGDAIQRIFSNCVGQTSGQGAEIEHTWPKPVCFDHIVLQEDIREGERVRAYVVEAKQDDQWCKIASGSCIGHKRIQRLDTPVTTTPDSLGCRKGYRHAKDKQCGPLSFWSSMSACPHFVPGGRSAKTRAHRYIRSEEIDGGPPFP